MPGDQLTRDLVTALIMFERAMRYLHPPLIPQLQEKLKPHLARLAESLNASESEGAQPEGLLHGASLACEVLDRFLQIEDMESAMANVLCSSRKWSLALETLYPLRRACEDLYDLFLEPPARERSSVLDPDPVHGTKVGLLHTCPAEDPYARGCFSLYIPESYDGSFPWPLVVALHGGYGHGRDFLWMWLREAKSRRFLLLAPTSRLDTWNIVQPAYDYDTLLAALEYIEASWRIDHAHSLLTGLSDGATYALACGLKEKSPFAALAPVAGALPPIGLKHAHGLRIFWVHGKHDWMFPFQYAQQDCARLKEAGADVTLRIINDLSHAYPRELNAAILTWLDTSLSLD